MTGRAATAPRRRIPAYRLVAWVGLALAIANAAVAVLPVGTGLRLPVALAFACVGPGAALLAHARLVDPVLTWALVVGLSLAVYAGTATAMIWTAWWQPQIVTVLTSAAVALSCHLATLRGRPG